MTNVVKAPSEKLLKMKEEDAKIIKGRFVCHEPKGGSVKFSYRKYKGEPVKTYYFEDGKNYDIPIGVAKHINNCGWDVHSHLLDAQGNPYVGVGKRELRFAFQSLDFV